MTKSFDKKQIGLAVACALALGILSGAAGAQDARQETAKDRAYVDDTRDFVVKSGFGLCWHSGFGPPPAAGPQCDPNYVAYVEPPPVMKAVAVAPPEMAPAPPPAVVVAPEAPPPRPARRDRN